MDQGNEGLREEGAKGGGCGSRRLHQVVLLLRNLPQMCQEIWKELHRALCQDGLISHGDDEQNDDDDDDCVVPARLYGWPAIASGQQALIGGTGTNIHTPCIHFVLYPNG